ncbi:DUF6622 family protein [Undibacterium aquatile]|uniref:Transmembrane protein n=1 Tax=Undibacterium aquatile TaxID=1537398 RepID=A0ABR6XJY5_9BURK|nr:DUF6622 family protein [Undibacterium aquatile]MBC3813215.1 hypothetical protein [Undibacterium aquatile]
MLQQILINTPIWVWALLAFLIYRGVLMSRDRQVTLRATFILPLLMLGLSLQGLIQHFGIRFESVGLWLLSAVCVSILNAAFFGKNSVRVVSEKLIQLQGSWMPLILMMLIFFLKYCENIAVVVQPELRSNIGFISVCSISFGIMNGLFLGKLLRVLSLLTKHKQPALMKTASTLTLADGHGAGETV